MDYIYKFFCSIPYGDSIPQPDLSESIEDAAVVCDALVEMGDPGLIEPIWSRLSQRRRHEYSCFTILDRTIKLVFLAWESLDHDFTNNHFDNFASANWRVHGPLFLLKELYGEQIIVDLVFRKGVSRALWEGNGYWFLECAEIVGKGLLGKELVKFISGDDETSGRKWKCVTPMISWTSGGGQPPLAASWRKPIKKRMVVR